MTQFAPGARALIRDEEWLIRRVDPSADGGWLLTCDGISDLGVWAAEGETPDAKLNRLRMMEG